MLYLHASRPNDENVAELVRLIFQGSPATDQACMTRRLRVYNIAINLLQEQDITSRAASEIVGFLLMEVHAEADFPM